MAWMMGPTEKGANAAGERKLGSQAMFVSCSLLLPFFFLLRDCAGSVCCLVCDCRGMATRRLNRLCNTNESECATGLCAKQGANCTGAQLLSRLRDANTSLCFFIYRRPCYEHPESIHRKRHRVYILRRRKRYLYATVFPGKNPLLSVLKRYTFRYKRENKGKMIHDRSSISDNIPT
jgi:hypothetical protein